MATQATVNFQFTGAPQMQAAADAIANHMATMAQKISAGTGVTKRMVAQLENQAAALKAVADAYVAVARAATAAAKAMNATQPKAAADPDKTRKYTWNELHQAKQKYVNPNVTRKYTAAEAKAARVDPNATRKFTWNEAWLARQKPPKPPKLDPTFMMRGHTGNNPLQKLYNVLTNPKNKTAGALAQMPGNAGFALRMGMEGFKFFMMLSAPLKLLSVAVAAFGAALNSAQRQMEAFSIKLLTGGNDYQAGQVQAIFSGMGLSGHQSGIAAGRITEHMMSDPKAWYWANRMGIGMQPGPYGETNSAKKILEVLNGLGKLKGAQRTQAAFAIAGGRNETFEYLMRYSGLSKTSKEMLKTDGFMNNMVYTSKRGSEGTEMSVEWQRLMENLKRFFDQAIAPLIPVFTFLLRVLNLAITGFTALVHIIYNAIKYLDPMHWAKEIFGVGDGSIFDDDTSDFTKDNTDAIKENTVQLQNFGREIFGKGAFANSAIPAGFGGIYANRSMEFGPPALGQLN